MRFNGALHVRASEDRVIELSLEFRGKAEMPYNLVVHMWSREEGLRMYTHCTYIDMYRIQLNLIHCTHTSSSTHLLISEEMSVLTGDTLAISMNFSTVVPTATS